MRARILLKIATTVALACGLLTQANAVPMLRLTTSTGATVTVTDGGANDSSSVDGLVLFNGPLGDWTINVTTGLSKPALGSDIVPILDLNSLNMTSSGPAGTITLEFTETGFASQPNSAHVGTSIGGTTTGNVTFRSFFDAANTAFGQGIELTNDSYSGAAFSGTGWNSLESSNPFSLTLLVAITHDARPWQITSFDANVQVPEPASLLLVGTGLLAMALFLARRRFWAVAIL